MNQAEEIDCVVIGAGVVGLACARALAMSGRDVIVIEANYAIGMETSSRNSEVIHSGIYYPTNSLKASACVRGRDLLYEYCDIKDIGHNKIGKLIVATNEAELLEIQRLHEKGQANGVTDLELITQAQALALEPNISCVGALWSPSTGIVDSHHVMLAMQGDLEDNGGMIAFNTTVSAGEITQDGVLLHTVGDSEFTLKSKLVINCAGLKAQDFTKALTGFDSAHIPPQYFARGVYFSLSGASPFSHLVYPAPEPGGLGVHATLDLGGQCRFGPDVEWIDEINYDVDPRRGDIFYSRIRKYWPDLQDGQLTPDYSGIRPKIVAKGQAAGDFIIQAPKTHGCGPLINLFGIESPGLTSSLALAEDVMTVVGSM